MPCYSCFLNLSNFLTSKLKNISPFMVKVYNKKPSAAKKTFCSYSLNLVEFTISSFPFAKDKSV